MIETAFPKKLLKGKSARIIGTMGMPAIVYRHIFRAYELKNLERNILKFSGINPVHSAVIGGNDADFTGYFLRVISMPRE